MLTRSEIGQRGGIATALRSTQLERSARASAAARARAAAMTPEQKHEAALRMVQGRKDAAARRRGEQ